MEQKNILVADDEYNSRFAIDFTLSRAGYMVEQACTGSQALSLLQERAANRNPFHLLITDIQMPDMNGIELIGALRDARIQVPVLVITGFGDKAMLVELVRRGCDYYLDKPFSPQDLLNAVETVLSKANAADARIEALQQKLLLSEKLSMIGQIAPKIAHEISNPAQVIQGYAELLMSKPGIDPDAKNMLTTIREAVQTIVKLNRNFMDLSKPFEMKTTSFRPEEPLEKAISFLTKAGVVKHCTVLKAYHQDTPCITADFMQLYQVFLNLIVNASHAMERSEKKMLAVSVHYNPGEQNVMISVADTGCGILPEHLDKIFDSFFTTRGDNGGTGLGLAVVKQIIENYKGTIQVQSRPGEGATFTISLPAEPCREGGAQ